jgi:DNA-binding MarR family transcriptional regulator
MPNEGPDPAAFTDTQRRAWAGFLRTHAAVTRALSAALEDEHRLTINEFEVLLCLSLNERLRLSELASRVNLTPSGLSGMVNRLGRRGLVARCTCLDDARAGYLELTEAGSALFDTACDAHVRRVQQLFLGRLSDEEQTMLGQLWTRFEKLGDAEPSSSMAQRC